MSNHLIPELPPLLPEIDAYNVFQDQSQDALINELKPEKDVNQSIQPSKPVDEGATNSHKPNISSSLTLRWSQWSQSLTVCENVNELFIRPG